MLTSRAFAPTVTTWTNVEKKHCAQNKFSDPYTTLLEAQNACANLGSSCAGVYDQKCDGTDNFYLCRVGAFKSSSSGSCVYTLGTTTPAPTTTTTAVSTTSTAPTTTPAPTTTDTNGGGGSGTDSNGLIAYNITTLYCPRHHPHVF